MACSGSMSNDEIKHRIHNVYTKFVSDVDPDGLSDWLVQEGVISIVKWQRIRLENLAIQDRCRALLVYLFSTQHPRAFLVVREALSKENHYLLEGIDKQESGYGDHVQLNAQVIPPVPIYKMSHADDIAKNYHILLRCTTINDYVIDFLKAEDVLDIMQEAKLRSKERNPMKQRILLFQWLKEVSFEQYESFLEVMKNTEQEHVANFLRRSTEMGHLPLSDARYRRLDKIRPKIANVIRVDEEVIAELRSSKAISRTDEEDIRAEKVDYAKVSKLLSIIMKRSNHSYDRFQEVLRKTLQTAADDYLNEGEMPAVHVNNNRPDLDEVLSSTFNQAIRNSSEYDTDITNMITEMNGIGLSPVKAIPGQSLVIFIYCKTVQNAAKFTQLFNSGRLHYILASILNRLLLTIEPHNTEQLDLRINMEDEEISSLEEFTGIEGFMSKILNKTKSSYLMRGCNVSTQTDEESFMKKMSGKPDDCDVNTQTDEKLLPGRKDKIRIEQLEKDAQNQKRAREADKNRLMEMKPEDKVKMQQLKKDYEDQKRAFLADIDRLLKTQTEEIAKIQQLEKDHEIKKRAWEADKDRLLKKTKELETRLSIAELRYKSDSVLLQKTKTNFNKMKNSLITTAAESKNIRGMAILNKELFLASDESSEVDVYDSKDFSFSRRWNLKELVAPTDIASCDKNKCLYIFNYKGFDQPNEILRVDPLRKLVNIWSTGNDYGWGLSVTYESNIILAVFKQNKLNEYSPDGHLIRNIDLSSDLCTRNPLHAIKLTSGHFVICQTWISRDDVLCRVCIVDEEGKLRKSFEGKPTSNIEQMNYPVHLCVDANGFVMVVDRDNNRVLFFDSDLQFKGEILSEDRHGLLYPEKILLDESNNRLLVANNERDNYRILIFYYDELTQDYKDVSSI